MTQVTVTVTEKVFLWLREHGAQDSNVALYAAFPDIKPATLKSYKNRFKSGHRPTINPGPHLVTSNSVTVTPVTPVDTTTKISIEVVERWILARDSRAELGMRFLQYKDKFAIEDTNDENEQAEFAELMQLSAPTPTNESTEETLDEFNNTEFEALDP